ncbi:MAG: thiamine-phosphate kinase [Myxococcales bacterium]|nr:thiamine-phosphate kinase [Myxococcales bacterium]
MRCLRDLGEFELIARIARAAGRPPPRSGVILGIGDDAALLRPRAGEDVAISADTYVENVHFRWRSDSPRSVGRRALVANLSDLAAMGARPLGFTLALAAPAALPVRRADALVAGMLHEARAHGCPLVGGNVTRARETHLAITAIGCVVRGRALRRGTARPGDRLLVTGTLGGAALERARAERAGGRVRHVATPRLSAGACLARIPAVSACIDISDGFDADLRQLLGEQLHAVVDERRLPQAAGFERACARLGLDARRLVRAGGEDYELLFTLRPSGPRTALLARRLGLRLTEVGRVVRGAPTGRTAGGWRHF